VLAADFKAWQEDGRDVNGAAHVPPGFVDAAARDYRLAPGSAALRLGIQSIDVGDVGPPPRLP
jgi:hypothetical protein